MNRTLPVAGGRVGGAFGFSEALDRGKRTSKQFRMPLDGLKLGHSHGVQKRVPVPKCQSPEPRASLQLLLNAIRLRAPKKQIFPEIRKQKGKCLVLSFKKLQPKLCSCPGGRAKVAFDRRHACHRIMAQPGTSPESRNPRPGGSLQLYLTVHLLLA